MYKNNIKINREGYKYDGGPELDGEDISNEYQETPKDPKQYVRHFMKDLDFYITLFRKINVNISHAEFSNIIDTHNINEELINKYDLIDIEKLNEEKLTEKLNIVLNQLLEVDNLTEVIIVMKYLSRSKRVFD